MQTKAALRWALMIWIPAGIMVVTLSSGGEHEHRTGRVLDLAAEHENEKKRQQQQQQQLDTTDADNWKDAVDDDEDPNAKGIDEAERVHRLYPYLRYDPRGEEACRQANEEHHQKHRSTYGSTTYIDGEEGLHLFFTTDCSQHSLWQAFTLENTWAKVRHPGALTRIVSGCFGSDGKPKLNQQLFTQRITNHPKHFIFWGPKIGGAAPKSKKKCEASKAGWYEGQYLQQDTVDGVDQCKLNCMERAECVSYNLRHGDKACYLFSTRTVFHDASDHSTGTCVDPKAKKGKGHAMPEYIANYPPINRPLTAMYWLYNSNPVEKVLGLLDPDMVFTRPLMFHVGAHPVEKGKPVGQFYPYLESQGWTKHYPAICTDHHDGLCKPIENVKDFAPGPPHFMAREDWKDLAVWWVRYTVEMRRVWGEWTSEMGGMSSGMARLGLKTHLVDNGMWDGTGKTTTLVQDIQDAGKEWRLCSIEGEECVLPAASGDIANPRYTVRYGLSHEASYHEATVGHETVLCTHSKDNGNGQGYFHGEVDPAPEQHKACWYKSEDADSGSTDRMRSLIAAANWVYCGNEGESCYLPPKESYTVRYGDGHRVDYKENKGVAGGSVIKCAAESWPGATSSGKRQCFYKAESGDLPPPTLREYFQDAPQLLPSLWHYCYTFENSRDGFNESFWHYSPEQVQWEKDHNEPSLKYWHWSKYRSLTDWGGQAEEGALHTLLGCEQPLLFELPPLPVMLERPYAKDKEHRGWFVFYSYIASEVNQAMMRWRLQSCSDKAKINFNRHVRTSHSDWWFSQWETVIDESAGPHYYKFKKVPEAAFEGLRFSVYKNAN